MKLDDPVSDLDSGRDRLKLLAFEDIIFVFLRTLLRKKRFIDLQIQKDLLIMNERLHEIDK